MRVPTCAKHPHLYPLPPKEGEEVCVLFPSGLYYTFLRYNDLVPHGKRKTRLTRVDEEEIQMKGAKRKRREGILRKNHPFFKLIAKGNDEARDVSASKYKYVGPTVKKATGVLPSRPSLSKKLLKDRSRE